jgi:hypothetical protein
MLRRGRPQERRNLIRRLLHREFHCLQNRTAALQPGNAGNSLKPNATAAQKANRSPIRAEPISEQVDEGNRTGLERRLVLNSGKKLERKPHTLDDVPVALPLALLESKRQPAAGKTKRLDRLAGNLPLSRHSHRNHGSATPIWPLHGEGNAGQARRLETANRRRLGSKRCLRNPSQGAGVLARRFYCNGLEIRLAFGLKQHSPKSCPPQPGQKGRKPSLPARVTFCGEKGSKPVSRKPVRRSGKRLVLHGGHARPSAARCQARPLQRALAPHAALRL